MVYIRRSWKQTKVNVTFRYTVTQNVSQVTGPSHGSDFYPVYCNWSPRKHTGAAINFNSVAPESCHTPGERHSSRGFGKARSSVVWTVRTSHRQRGAAERSRVRTPPVRSRPPSCAACWSCWRSCCRAGRPCAGKESHSRCRSSSPARCLPSPSPCGRRRS